MEFKNNLWESKESIVRQQASPQDVEKVWQDIEYSNRLIKAHNVMKVLDLPDEQDNPIRQMLLKQDDNTLDELAKKSKQGIQAFILNERNQKIDTINNETDQENKTIDQKLSKIKQAFPQSILDKNHDIADKFKLVDSSEEPAEKDKILQEILQTLKNPWKLKSITDQLWWADKNNPQYLEFKNALIWVDSGFENYFKDLESIHSWASLSANKIVAWIEKDSWAMIDIDLKSNPPLSKLSLVWSAYSFDEEIDKKALEKIKTENQEKMDELQNSITVLKGLYKPFDFLLTSVKQDWWKQDFKEKFQENIAGFPREIFGELELMYKQTGIKSDDQITQADIQSLADIGSPADLKQKIEHIKEKLQKIKTHIQEMQAKIADKYKEDTKKLLTMKSEEKKKQVEVLSFMQNSGFDLIPKEITDSILREVQGGTLVIPWLDMNVKNIDLKNGNFWENSIYRWVWLNDESKANMVKFINKMISWNINEPLWVDSIVSWTFTADSSLLQSKFLEAGIVDAVGWNKERMMSNLEKASLNNAA